MKKKVNYNRLSICLTIGCLALLLCGLIFTRDDSRKFWVLLIITLGLIVPSLYYSPVALEADEDGLIIHKRIGRKKLPYSGMAGVEEFTPVTWGLQRLVASGGFAGYYGWFHNPSIGVYFGYYGNPEQSFLIEMKDGKRYAVSCEEPIPMIDFIKKRIGQK